MCIGGKLYICVCVYIHTHIMCIYLCVCVCVCVCVCIHMWASLEAQMIKNMPAMQETWVQSLGWEDPLEKGKATHSGILARRLPWNV